MNPRARAFRQAASHACTRGRYSFRRFMADGLEEILEAANEGDWSAQEIAAHVLAECCVEEGRFNNFRVGLLAVMAYLNEQCGGLGTGEQQAYADLIGILNSGGQLDAIRRWFETHYPNP